MNMVKVTMPRKLPGEMLRAVREDPTTKIDDREEWYARLGWLLCAWEVLVNYRLPPEDD